MALKYNVEYKFTAVLGDKEIKFRPWTTKNEKDYLIAVEAEEEITDEMLFDMLVRPCLENPNIILSTNEQKMLMIEIRKKSLGSTFPMRFVCRECNQVNDIDVDFNKIVKFRAEKWEDITIEDITFCIGDIPSQNLKEKINSVHTNVEKSFIEFLVHINSMVVQGSKEDTFTFDELKEFVEGLPTNIFDEAYKQFREMKSTLDFEFKTVCGICGKENDIDFDYLPNFLWV